MVENIYLPLLSRMAENVFDWFPTLLIKLFVGSISSKLDSRILGLDSPLLGAPECRYHWEILQKVPPQMEPNQFVDPNTIPHCSGIV